MFAIVNTSSLDISQEGGNRLNNPLLFGSKQNSKATNDLDLVQARHLSSSLIVQQKAICMQLLVERHSFQLTLAQAGDRNHEIPEINLGHLTLEV